MKLLNNRDFILADSPKVIRLLFKNMVTAKESASLCHLPAFIFGKFARPQLKIRYIEIGARLIAHSSILLH